jgi:hypothetical protein
MPRIPKFTSLKAERDFWDRHDAVEVLGDRGWKLSAPGATSVRSLYVTKVGTKGAMVHIPRDWLTSIGARKGRKIKAQVRGRRLVMELV